MDTQTQFGSASHRGAVASQISREIVQLHASHYGRGPTKAKTHVSDDHVLCLLEDVFTPAERTLVRAGNEDQVMATRHAFQVALRDEFVGIVERATGREVRAFMSTVNVEPEMSAELFVLVPTPALESVSHAEAAENGTGPPDD
jgi:uncharacterized protein YbcI